MSAINREQALLLAIALYHRQHGYAPSIRDLQRDCGISTTSVVKYHLERLRERGLVDWKDGQARTVHIVQEAQS
jgi:repressor LexA